MYVIDLFAETIAHTLPLMNGVIGVSAFALIVVICVFVNNHGTFQKGLQGFLDLCFSQLFSPKIRKASKRGFFAVNDLFVWFLQPQNRGGGFLLLEFCPKMLKSLKFSLFSGIFCLLWAGPAERCCTPVYLPLEDFHQIHPFSLDSLDSKYGWGGC